MPRSNVARRRRHGSVRGVEGGVSWLPFGELLRIEVWVLVARIGTGGLTELGDLRFHFVDSIGLFFAEVVLFARVVG